MNSPFKTVLLTTDTTHHLYFAWKLVESFGLQSVLLETAPPSFGFETRHSFEDLRDQYEREVLLAGCPGSFESLAETVRIERLNGTEGVETLRRLDPEVIIVFGTGKLVREVFGASSVISLNLHGGNPEQYRGLDTHLWAIYHRDFENLVTTLHTLEADLDAGDIVFQSQIDLSRTSQIQQLRAFNTRVCVQISILALDSLSSSGTLPMRRQIGKGRYYSAMPSVLKEGCIRKFNRHVARL